MRVKAIASLLIGAALMAIQGCGGGGGGGGAAIPAGSTVLAGTATKGPIAGGTVKVFGIISSSTSTPRAGIPRLGAQLGEDITGADGSYSIILPPGSNGSGVLVQITGGSYKDEATGATLNVADQFGANGLRAAVGNLSGATQVSVSVTPLTEMAYQGGGAQLTDSAIAAANTRVANAFEVADIVGTRPADATQTFPAGTTPAAQKYALALASLSQYQKDFSGGKLMSEICTTLATDLEDGALNPQAEAEIDSSSNNYASSGNNANPILVDPTVNPNAPVTLAVTPASPVSLAIGGSQQISAEVKKADGGAVPDGTFVTFSTSLGSFSGAGAVSAINVPTINGIANATLTSAAVGAASVSIKAGAATGAASITFFDPNSPAGITLSAGASQGITNGTPVLLSATVTRLAGGPVPDGTPVTFAIVSGSGALSAATTTSGGIASVNLTSTVAGASVTVSATAGSASQTISVPFIAQPTQAIVTVRSTGTLPGATLIGGINATVLYSGNKGLSIAPAGITVSGAGVGSTLIPNTTVAGQVVLGLLNVEGIGAGEFATLRFSIVPGNFPTAADFSISPSGLSVIDTATQDIAGMGVVIGSVTIQ